jgi:hypothetical protein
VPSADEDDVDDLAKAYCDSPKGRDVLDRFIPSIPRLLSPNGVFYVVFLYPHNDLPELSSLLQEQGLTGRVVLARREGIESLAIIRYARPDTEALLPVPLRDALPVATESAILSMGAPKAHVTVTREDAEDTHMKVDFDTDEDNPFSLFD